MQEFLLFFENITFGQKAAALGSALTISWLLEAGIPLIKFDYKKLKHIGINFVFLGFTFAINTLFAIILLDVFNWTEKNGVGLLNMTELPVWLELLVAVLFFDLIAQYTAHYILHKKKWLWKFHMIHHSDTKVDATTGTRHHPGDYIVREVFALIVIVISGATFAYYMFYRIITIFFTYLTHANIKVPLWLDKPLSFVFITPNIHKFHHHFERPWTDSNFGNVFSFWDRMFGTLVYEDTSKIKYGLDVLEGKSDEDIIFQLKIPFDNSIKTDY